MAPMTCCFGATGSGKTYALKLMCGKLVKYGKAKLTVCDGKGGGDFDFLRGCERYDGIEVTAVFNNFYQSFLARQKGEDESRDIMCLLFDEWSAYLDSLDSKAVTQEQIKAAADAGTPIELVFKDVEITVRPKNQWEIQASGRASQAAVAKSK